MDLTKRSTSTSTVRTMAISDLPITDAGIAIRRREMYQTPQVSIVLRHDRRLRQNHPDTYVSTLIELLVAHVPEEILAAVGCVRTSPTNNRIRLDLTTGPEAAVVSENILSAVQLFHHAILTTETNPESMIPLILPLPIDPSRQKPRDILGAIDLLEVGKIEEDVTEQKGPQRLEPALFAANAAMTLLELGEDASGYVVKAGKPARKRKRGNKKKNVKKIKAVIEQITKDGRNAEEGLVHAEV
ncbi:hypothetical protein HDU79_007429 [Rhizoclosmatium sp. JEL0117]|nr:hypothetical protein HDU79_007429 [Rhizoclosmatium sp. JEL0117]